MQKLLTGKTRFSEFSDEWKKSSFTNIFERIPNKKFQIKSNEYLKNGRYPVIDQGKKSINGYSNNKNKLFKNQSIIVFGDHTRELKYINFSFIIGADGTQLIKAKNKHDNKFFYYQLASQNIPNTGYNRHFKFLLAMVFFTPLLSEQIKIAHSLTLVDNKIDKLQEKLALLRTQKKGLMQQLLTGKIRVKA